MHDCNDPYIIERLYAAAFGACCIDPTQGRLRTYSEVVFNYVFSKGKPPVALLTRDYALGIIELAAIKKSLDDSVQVDDCYHPFGSAEPIFGLTEEDVEMIADGCGGKSILQSASNEWGDYGKYIIPGRVDKFLTSRLTAVKPVSMSEIKDQFEEEVINTHPERINALEAYRIASRAKVILQHRSMLKMNENIASEIEGSNAGHDISEEDALSRLEDTLDAEGRRRLHDELLNNATGRGDYSKVNVDQCRLWVTRRAYELGWTAELFPHDGHGTSPSRHENDLERIGKKYQRIALDELQARLADNFWILEGWPERPHTYRYSHHDFRRNIEPTILPTEKRYSAVEAIDTGWLFEPAMPLVDVADSSIWQWPFAQDPTISMSDKVVRVDGNRKRWLVLYEFNSVEKMRKKSGVVGYGKHYEEFRFFYCVFVKKGNAAKLIAYLAEKKALTNSEFEPNDFIDGPFLREAFWRDTWQGEKFSGHIGNAAISYEFAKPVVTYRWESHLDKSLQDGFSCYLPQKWLAEELELKMSRKEPLYWENCSGDIAIQSQHPSANQAVVVMDENLLRKFAEREQIEPVWIMIGERNSWPGDDNASACWRRSEGAIWLDNKNWKQVGWNHDTK